MRSPVSQGDGDTGECDDSSIHRSNAKCNVSTKFGEENIVGVRGMLVVT